MGVKGSLGVMLTPSLLPSDSQFRCPHLPLTHFFFSWSLAIFSPLVAGSFHLCLWCHLLSDYLSVNTCTHMCPQLHKHTAKHHRITPWLLSETHVPGGTSLDPQINIEKNLNIMFSIMCTDKLMNNNNSKNEKRLNSVSSILPTAGKQKSTPSHLNFSPQRVRRFCRITGNYMWN